MAGKSVAYEGCANGEDEPFSVRRAVVITGDHGPQPIFCKIMFFISSLYLTLPLFNLVKLALEPQLTDVRTIRNSMCCLKYSDKFISHI